MNHLAPVFVVGIITLGIYRLFELFVRRKERMTILEKLGEQIGLSEANVNLNLPFFQKSKNNWALNFSLLLIGVGMGLVVAYCIESASIGGNITNYYSAKSFGYKIEVIYFACVAIFGGIGLLVAYLIEQKNK